MSIPRGATFALLLTLPIITGGALKSCGLTESDFVRVSLSGFDPVDYETDRNDYPWSMEFHQAPGNDTGYVYVGTGNNIAGYGEFVQMPEMFEHVPFLPAEIRRYRPDQGPQTWETVLDFKDIDSSEYPMTGGVRRLFSHTPEDGGQTYLYAGTFGDRPSIWRSISGDPNTWERIISVAKPGSIRWITAHNGLIYFATTVLDLIDENFDTAEGIIYAYDGTDFWPVIEDGFGNPNNLETICLQSFNGWLYAGTRNLRDGYEIWKFAGPPEFGDARIPIALNGGPNRLNRSAGTPFIFQGRLYMGSLIFGGLINLPQNTKGCDLIRIDADDQWETVVGENSISGIGPGFDNPRNAYLWWMEEHDGWLYAGTWDDSIFFIGGLQALGAMRRPDEPVRDSFPILEAIYTPGADLYRSQDGVHWAPVFKNGLGDFNNYGVRSMKSAQGRLFLGLANPSTGLQIWASQ